MATIEERDENELSEEFRTRRHNYLKEVRLAWKIRDVIPGLQLTVGDGQKQQDPDTLVTWCLPESAVAKLQQEAEKNEGARPFILLSAVGEDGQESVWQIELFTRMATYITFPRPGPHHLFAVVFWSGCSLKEVRRNFYSSRNYHRRIAMGSLFNRDASIKFDLPLFKCCDFESFNLATSLISCLAKAIVEVPAEFFAKEWPEWAKNWVDGWYDQPSRDECQFRRRALFFAIPIKPWIVLLAWLTLACLWPPLVLFRVILAFLVILLAGKPNRIKWRGILGSSNPVSRSFCEWSTGNIWDDNPEDYWGDPISFKTPLLWFILLLSGGIIVYVSPFSLVVSLSLLLGGGMTFSFVGWLAYKFVTQPSLREIPNRISKSLFTKTDDWLERLERKQQSQAHQQLEQMVCPTEVHGSLADLPEEKRTFRLRYQELKSRVCRPFAR